MVCSRTPPQASKIYRLSTINHLRVAYLIHYPEKWRWSLWCRSGQVEATAVTLCHGKLIAGLLTAPIDSIYSNLKVPATGLKLGRVIRVKWVTFCEGQPGQTRIINIRV